MLGDSMKKLFNFIQEYYLYFMMYSIIGWIYEVFIEVFIKKWGFSNRGVLFGPYCPVYGFGALFFIFLVYKLIKDKPLKRRLIMIPVIFVLCTLIATSLELVTSYICEYFMGSWPWQTYVEYKFNFQARIALNPSLRFGLGGLLFLYILQPLFEKVIKVLGNKKMYPFVIILSVFVIDMIYTFILK